MGGSQDGVPVPEGDLRGQAWSRTGTRSPAPSCCTTARGAASALTAAAFDLNPSCTQRHSQQLLPRFGFPGGQLPCPPSLPLRAPGALSDDNTWAFAGPPGQMDGQGPGHLLPVLMGSTEVATTHSCQLPAPAVSHSLQMPCVLPSPGQSRAHDPSPKEMQTEWEAV